MTQSEWTACLQLHDVLETSPSDDEPVEVGLKIVTGRRDDGIVLTDAQGRQRVVIENKDGQLTVQVWMRDPEPSDPSHTILLAPTKGLVYRRKSSASTPAIHRVSGE